MVLCNSSMTYLDVKIGCLHKLLSNHCYRTVHFINYEQEVLDSSMVCMAAPIIFYLKLQSAPSDSLSSHLMK